MRVLRAPVLFPNPRSVSWLTDGGWRPNHTKWPVRCSPLTRTPFNQQPPAHASLQPPAVRACGGSHSQMIKDSTVPGSLWGRGRGGGGGLIKKTDKCKPEVMHSTVTHKCIFILYAKPGQTSRHALCLKQKKEGGRKT